MEDPAGDGEEEKSRKRVACCHDSYYDDDKSALAESKVRVFIVCGRKDEVAIGWNHQYMRLGSCASGRLFPAQVQQHTLLISSMMRAVL
jgi:hypothetical protein